MNALTKKYSYPPRIHFWIKTPEGKSSTIYMKEDDYERLKFYALGSKRIIADAVRQAASNVFAKGHFGSLSSAVVQETESVLALDYRPGKKYLVSELTEPLIRATAK